jgi:hypothetical protein
MIYYRGKQYEMEKNSWGRDDGLNKKVKVQNALLLSETQTTAEQLGKQYGVSADTIKRDAKVAKVIDKIGETSPIAKQKILSGDVDINKKELEKLSANKKDTSEILEQRSFERTV